MSASIQVAIKVRPLIKREEDENLPIQWSVQDKCITPLDPEMKKRGEGGFHFDHIFDMSTTTVDVYNTIAKPIVEAAVNGFNGTIFAYGQTSSGKTYTMMGTPNEPGVIPLSVINIFDLIQSSDRQFLLRVSYIEIYNERVNDLLDQYGTDLKIKDDGKGQAFVHCKEELVNSPERVLEIMKKGDKNRRIGETNMNERSSRSHTILRITIESREADADETGAIQVSQLNLVDLAGSERAGQTGAIGTRFKEGTHINMSLSALGLVILQLSESQDNPKIFVNFRDSKLTRILQPSLGGNAMTTIICAVTPAALEETQCTLAFASRAKRIKNKPKLNEELSEAALLKRYATHISKLEKELKKVKSTNVVEMESKLLEKERANRILEDRIELLKKSILCGNSGSGKEDAFKSDAKRRRTWGGPGTLMPTPNFHKAIGLPTIIESDRTPEKKKENFKQQSKGRQSILVTEPDISNEIFQLEFPDFEKELIARERERINGRPSDASSGSDQDDDHFITRRTVKFCDDVSVHSSARRSLDATIEPKSPGQCNDERALPETPKAALRKRISILMEQYNSLSEENGRLMEFTRLEKQMIVDEEIEKAMVEHNEKLAASEQIICELNDKYTKLQIHSAESDRLLADSNDRLSELERQMAESINSLRVLKSEKQALVDELNKYKSENQAAETSMDNREDKEMSVFANASYFDEMNVSDVRADSVLGNDTQNTQDLTMNDTNVGNITANTTVTNDVREVKFLAEKLKETVQLLTVENTEVTNKLANEKERANKNEKHLQDTISELLTKIHAITEEKNLLKNSVWELEHRLERTDSTAPTNPTEDETAKSIENYKSTIASLTAENIELSSNLMNKIEELDRVKGLKSAPCNHDCEYRELSANLSEKNKLLEKENIELSNDLMEKIEEHDHLRENFEALRSQLALLTSQENSNNIAEKSINRSILIQKEKSDGPSAEFVNDLLQLSAVEEELILDSNENGHSTEPTTQKPESSDGSEIGVPTIDELLQTSIIPNAEIRENASNGDSLHDSSWKTKAELLAKQVVHLRLLNKKSRRALRDGVKVMNSKLAKLQEKFDRESADSEILRTKASEDLNITVADSTMNESSILDGSFSVSVLEDSVQRLCLELDTLKDNCGKLSDDCNEKCDEVEKLQETSGESPRVKRRDNKYVKLETKQENVRTELRRLKKDMAAVSARLQKFFDDKTIVNNEMESLKAEERELQEKLEKTVDSSIAEERIRSLENEVSRLSEEVDASNTVKEELMNAKTALETEIHSLKITNQSYEVKIAEIKNASAELETIVSLEKDLDRLTEEVERLNNVKEDLETAKSSLEAEVSSLRVNKESLGEKISDTEDMSISEEKVKRLENDLVLLRREIEISNNSKEELESAKSSLEAEVRVFKAANESMEEKLRQMEVEVARLNEQIGNSNYVERELENAKSLLETEVRSLQAEKESMEEKLGKMDIEVARLNEQIGNSNMGEIELENAKSSLEAEVRSLQAAKESLEEKVGQMKIEVARLTEQIGNSNFTEQELENAKSLLEAEVRSLQTAKEILEEKLGQMDIEVARLNEQIGNTNIVERELENAKSSLEAEVRSLQTAKEILEEKLGQMEIEVARLNEQIGNSNIVERELENAKSLLEAEVQSLQTAKETLEEKLRQMEIEVARLNEQIGNSNMVERELENAKSLLEAEVQSLQTANEALDEKLGQMEMEVARLNEQISASNITERELEAAKVSLEAEVRSLLAAKESLEMRFSKPEESSLATEKISATEAELNDAQTQLKHHTESLDDLVAKNTELKSKLMELEESVEELTKSKLLLNNEVESLRSVITKLESSSSVQNQRLSDEKSESNIESLTNEKSDLLKDEKSDLLKNEKSELFKDEKSDLFKDEKSDLPKDEKSDLPKDEKSDLPKDEKSDLLKDEKSDLLKDEKSDLLKSEKSDLVKSEKSDLLKDEKTIDALTTMVRELTIEIDRYAAENAELNTKLSELKNTLTKNQAQNSTESNSIEIEEKLREEVTSARECITKEIKSMKPDSDRQCLTEKSISELIGVFLHELMSKEKEIIKMITSSFEEKKRKLEESARQSVDAEKRTNAWAKELEADIERTQQDLHLQEAKNAELNSEIARLKNLLMEISHENKMLKEKMEVLELDFNTLQSDLENSREFGSRSGSKQNTTLNTTQQERLIEETLTTREMELSSKLRLAEKQYREKLDELTNNVESLKIQNMDLTNNLEGLKMNEKELKNAVDTKSSELAKCNNMIEKMQVEIEDLTDKRNSLSSACEEKSRQLEEITILLKNKCDLLSEYKTKLETMTPEYELLKDQASERNARLEKCKIEIERMTKENEKLTTALREKLDSEEKMSASYGKQLADLTNRNTALQTELDELRVVVDAKSSEIERLTKENEKLTAALREKLDSEEAMSASYGKQLADLTNRNTALQTELDELRVVVDAKSSELQKCNNTIEKMQVEIENLTEKNNSLGSVCDEKNKQLEEITILLKNKSDLLSEIKTKLDTMTPEYELLKDQASERNAHLEKYRSEIERLTKENEKLTAALREKLDSEEVKSTGYRKELANLANRNTALQTELDELRAKCDELERANGKLTKTLRSRTSGIRAEEEMEDLRDSNRTLQRNLDGAANRIAELQEMRTQTMKELAELRGIYEIVCNENTEMKYTISVHRSSVNDALELRGKYELLLQEKNRVVVELEEKKTEVVVLERKLESQERDNEELKLANKELDEEVEDMVKKIHELTKENAELDDKLYMMSTQNSGGEKGETNEHELEIEKLKSQIDRLRQELAVALKTSECSRSDPLSCDSSRSGSPALEQEAARIDNRRRRSRTELFNQKRQLEVFVEDEKFPWGEGCRCVALEKKVRELEHELVSKNGEVAALEIRIQSENFPYIKKAKDLEELLGASKRRVKILEVELQKLRELKYIEMSSECSRCKQWEANKRDQSSQCMPDSAMIRMQGMSSGIVEERIKMEKREKVIDTLKSLCRARQRNILELEKKNKELERRVKELDTNLDKISLREDDKSDLSTVSSQTTNSRLDSGRAMKENVPMTQDVQRPATHSGRNWFNN